MTKLHVKKGDTVLVIAGKDKGKTGKILNAMPSENAVVVEGVNFVYKHKKARNAQEKGGIVKVEGKINASNVQVICPECKKATRVAVKANEKGKNVRVCNHKECGASLDKAVSLKKTAKKADTKVAEASKATKATKAPAKETKTAAPKTTTAAKKSSTTKTNTVVRKTGDKV